jgi:hypothetical protein
MFGGTPKMPAADQKSLGVRNAQLGTAEQARPVPIFAGTQRIGSTWLSELFNVHYLKSKRGDYTLATWALLHCAGQIDTLYKFIWDNKVIWEGALSLATGTSSWTFTVPDIGPVTVKFGTNIQAAHTALTAHTNHPAYRNLCYSVYNDCVIGVGRATPPNVEIVAGRWPKPAWWYGSDSKIGADVNAAAFIADLLQDSIFGLGLPDSRIDTSSFNDVGLTLLAEGLGISPLITRRQGMRQIIADVLGTIDGYLYLTTDGKIAIGLVRATGAVTALAEAELTEAPSIDPQAWAATLNMLNVAYTSADSLFDTRNTLFIDRANFQVTGVTRSETVQRPWLTNEVNAQRVALALGARMALPTMRGTAKVRRSVARSFLPGEPIGLTWSALGLDVAARVTSMTIPKPKGAPEITLEWELDRGYLNAEFFTPEAGVFAASGGLYDPPPQKLIEWPWMREHNTPQLLTLLARTGGGSVGFFAHARWPSGTYELAGFTQNMAMKGHVVDANYPADTTVIDGGLGIVVQFDGYDGTLETITLDDALENKWMLMVDGEICSAYGATLLAIGKYRIFLVRELFDTVRAAHNINAEVWVFRLDSAAFFPAMDQLATQTFKLQQVLDRAPEDLGGVTAVATTTTQRFWRPIEPRNLAAFGDKVNPTYTTGQDVPLSWTVRDLQQDGYWEGWEGGQTIDGPDTALEFYTTGGVLKQTVEVLFDNAVSPASAYTLTNANLVSWFGSEVSFDVRAYHRRNGFRSTRYASLRVSKI